MKDGIRVLIIGGVACGPKAASRLKRLMPNADVTMIERGRLVSYGACGLPYYVEGTFPDVGMLCETPASVKRTPVFFEKVKGFHTLTRTEADLIDRNRKIVRVRNLDSGTQSELPYDKLVLATGSRPIVPPIEGIDLKNVWFMRHPDDAESMVEQIENQKLRHAVLVGAGYIGIEMAEALRGRGLEVTLIEIFDQILPQFLDFEMAALAAKHLRSKGVRLILGEAVNSIEGNGMVSAVVTENNRIPADLVVIGAGVRPNDELAREAGLACAPKGGIIINSYCQTSAPDIYAGGDCVVNQCMDPVIKDPVFVPLGSTANKHGRTIADHIAGISAPFPGISATGICKAFDYNLGRTGLTEKQARLLYPDIETTIWSGPALPHYIPQSKPLIIKMVASRRSRKLLGVQVVGMGDAAKRIDVAATALFFGATIDELAVLDLAYAPHYAPPIDPIAATAHLLANKLDGLAQGISSLEAEKRMRNGNDFVLLDVRTPDEFRMLRLPDDRVVHIPLGALREKVSQLPRDKDILAFCKVSMRGYEAQRILNAEGFDRVWFIEGGLVGWPFELAE
ncbi:FAD-dependent pyridine nucleotide-disulfide oxidoreductase [Syntrophobacter sp. SbD1]|nr:FAD-dependent pyridine nucleotide-disulfide oxidoreductase [Syntrophobacter sp. SbD1]